MNSKKSIQTPKSDKNELSIYIHWPFCKSKCPYCDFYKEVRRDIDEKALVDEYIESLHRYYDLTSELKVKSIFFGGGTPSLMSAQSISRIIDFISKKWKMIPNTEISLEANPNTHHRQMFKQIKDAGINRISLGVQSLNDDDLRFLGRTHNSIQAKTCLEEMVKTFSNHSADFIYSLPSQTMENWLLQLSEILAFGLKHISIYQLTIEEGTLFAKKKIHPLDDDKSTELYMATHNYLQQKGYCHYEVSNFAKDGYQSIHNLTYWQGGQYIGIGKSAHGRLILNDKYIATEYPFLHETLTPQQRAEELIIMGLRLSAGINKKSFKQYCSLDFDDFINKHELHTLTENGLVINQQDSLHVTLQGMMLLNQIILKLCS